MNARSFFYITFVLFCPLNLILGQVSEGFIHYEQKTDLQKLRSNNNYPSNSKSPQFRISDFILYFNKTESVYQVKEDLLDEKGSNFYNRRNYIMYKNHINKKGVESRYLLGKQFLISGKYDVLKWKITAESKNVGSFYCQKAIYIDSLQTVEAWFTPMIPIMSGPADYVGLPGLILHVDIDEGTKTITAKEVFLEELEKNLIVKPTEGKKISREDFEILQKEKKQELNMNRSRLHKNIKRKG